MAEVDPTRTLTLRRQYEAALLRRIRELQARVRDAVRTRDVLALDTLLRTDVLGGMQSFERFVTELADRHILEVVRADGTPIVPRGTQWQEEFVTEAYLRGTRRANQVLRTAELATPLVFRGEVNVQRMQRLFIQNFETLQGMTADLARQTRETIGAGMLEGVGSEEMARRLDHVIEKRAMDGGMSIRNRARALARTEVIRAHAEGVLDEYQQAGITVVIPLVEYTFVRDLRVCPACLRLGRNDLGLGPGVYPIQEAHGIIPVHVMCRCSWLPAGFAGADDRRRQRQRNATWATSRLRQLETSPAARTEQRKAQAGRR